MEPAVFDIVFPLWVKSFALTLIIEIPIFSVLVRREVPLWRGALAGALGTCFTHPCLWFIWPFVVRDYVPYIVSGELLIATIESLTFFAVARPISIKKAIGVSFVANAASYGIGALLHVLGIA
jgi:hypothetical protein